DYICQCNSGYKGSTNDVDCTKKKSVNLYDSCADDSQCGTLANCFSGMCECDAGYVSKLDNYNCEDEDDDDFEGTVVIGVVSFISCFVLLVLLVFLRIYLVRRRVVVAQSASRAAYLGPYLVAPNLYQTQGAPPPYQPKLSASVDSPSAQS